VITDVGKNILAKYLIGQAPAYASFIAIGVGPRPLAVGQSLPDFSEKEQLDFEVLRMPISSRGFVYNDQGEPNIVFLAEIPGDQRYGITEIGIFPGRANPSAGGLDSKMLYTFAESENWEYHTQTSASSIPTIVSPLNESLSGSIINPTNPDGSAITVFRASSNNIVFSSPERLNLFERPRFLDRALLVRGDLSSLVIDNGNVKVSTTQSPYPGSHIHYNGISLDLDSNSTEDELRLAFSVMSKEDVQTLTVQSVRLLVEFVNADVDEPVTFAKFQVELNQSDPNVNFATNRYFVVKKKLGELIRSPNFTWDAVNSVRIYATVIQAGQAAPSQNFYISFDALRFENTTIKNPLYGLTGYSVIKTPDGKPIVKESNTSNSIEFRFGLDVL
jgi:hypothetical protein